MSTTEKNFLFSAFTGSAIFVLLVGCFAVVNSDFNSLAPLVISICIALLLVSIAGLLGPKRPRRRQTNNAPVRSPPTQIELAVRPPAERAPVALPGPVAESQPQRTRRAQWEHSIAQAILFAWTEAMYKPTQTDPGQYDVDLGAPRWSSGAVVFPLRFTNLLPTPSVRQYVTQNFAMGLRAVLRTEHSERVADATMVNLRHGVVEVTVPNPNTPPSSHAKNMMEYVKPAVPISERSAQRDVTGLVGVTLTDELLRINCAQQPVALFVGKTRAGKSANLMGVLAGMLAANGPDRLHVYIAAYRANQWAGASHLPHVQRLEYTPAGIANMLQELQGMVQRNAGVDAAGDHPSVLLVLDDLSGISKMSNWDDIVGPLTQITMSGGGAYMYTWITTHRITEAGGVGKGARAIVLNAGARIATFSHGGSSIMADHLGVTRAQAESIPMPRARVEAAVSFDGEPPEIIRTVWANPDDVYDVVMRTRQWVDGASNASAGNGSGNGVYSTAQGGTHGYTAGVEGDTPAPSRRSTHVPDTADSAVPVVDSRISNSVRRSVRERDKDTCVYCLRPGSDTQGPDGKPWHFDHMLPESRNGSGSADNVVLSCAKCNQRKGAMTPAEFIDTELARLDGSVPRLRKDADGQWLVGPFELLRIWYAKAQGLSWNKLAIGTQGSTGGAQIAKCRAWVVEGERQYERIRQASEDSTPTGIEWTAFVDEIEAGDD